MSVAVFVPPLLLKRYRLIGYIVVANLATVLLVGVATWWLDQAAAGSLIASVVDRLGATSNGSLNLWTLAQLTSSFVILAPFVGRRWRQAGMVILATFVLGRIVLVSGGLSSAEIFLGRRDRRDGRGRGAPRVRSPRIGARPSTRCRRRSRRARCLASRSSPTRWACAARGGTSRPSPTAPDSW